MPDAALPADSGEPADSRDDQVLLPPGSSPEDPPIARPFTLSPNDCDARHSPRDRRASELTGEIRRLASLVAAARHELVAAIRAFDEEELWREHACTCCAHWLTWKIGLDRRTAREYVRVANALRELPEIDAAFAAGEIPYSKVRAVTRIATPTTDGVLSSVARNANGAQLETICRLSRRAIESTTRQEARIAAARAERERAASGEVEADGADAAGPDTANSDEECIREAARAVSIEIDRSVRMRRVGFGKTVVSFEVFEDERAIVEAAIRLGFEAMRAGGVEPDPQESAAVSGRSGGGVVGDPCAPGSSDERGGPAEPLKAAPLLGSGGSAEPRAAELSADGPRSSEMAGATTGGIAQEAAPSSARAAFQPGAADEPSGSAEPPNAAPLLGSSGSAEPRAADLSGAGPLSSKMACAMTGGIAQEAAPSSARAAFQPGAADEPRGSAEPPNAASLLGSSGSAGPRTAEWATDGQSPSESARSTSDEVERGASLAADRPGDSDETHGPVEPRNAAPLLGSGGSAEPLGTTGGPSRTENSVTRARCGSGGSPGVVRPGALDALLFGLECFNQHVLDDATVRPRTAGDRNGLHLMVRPSVSVLEGTNLGDTALTGSALTGSALTGSALGESAQAAPSDRPESDAAPDLDALIRSGDLTRPPGGGAHRKDGTWLPRETVERICCEAGLTPILESTTGEVLDVGRSRRTVPPAIRKALEVRDRGCRFPGCANHGWTDAHHIVHWAGEEQGRTALDNLVLLCHAHHVAVHEGRVTVKMGTDAVPRFFAPDGTPLRSECDPLDASSEPVRTLARSLRAQPWEVVRSRRERRERIARETRRRAERDAVRLTGVATDGVSADEESADPVFVKKRRPGRHRPSGEGFALAAELSCPDPVPIRPDAIHRFGDPNTPDYGEIVGGILQTHFGPRRREAHSTG